jgi:hypothetical protein
MLKRFILLMLIALLAFSPTPAGAIKYKGDLEANESLTLPEQNAKPANPASGKRKLYFKDNGAAYSLDPSGNENPIDRAGFKNYFINGDFDLWQRGTSFTASGVYTADRWKQNHNTAGATYSRQAFTLGQTDVPGEPRYFMRVAVTSAAASTSSVLRHRIEGVRTLAGQTATLSFWAQCDTPKTFNITVAQIFGTGGTPSSPVTVVSSNRSIGTGWARYTVTVNINSLTGKTIGINGDDYLEVHILETGSFSTFTLELAQFQMEKGSIATDFEQRPAGLELALAQRYFEKSFPLNTPPTEGYVNPPYLSVMTITTTARRGWLPFVTRKRAPPAVTYYKAAGMTNDGRWNVRESASIWTERTPTTNTVNENGVVVQVDAAGAIAGQGIAVQGHWTADAEL